MNDNIFTQVIALVLSDAQDRKSSAGYSGSMGDGGAGVLEAQVQFFQYGWNKTFPPEWGKYKRQAIKEADPEYAEYLRLHQKFGDK
jgi:hypothetical protein